MLSRETRQALTSMFSWRDDQINRRREALELLLNDFFYTASPADVPVRHRAALQVFQDLSNMEQAALVSEYCKAHDSSRE